MSVSVPRSPTEKAADERVLHPAPPRMRPEQQLSVAHMMLGVLILALGCWLVLNLGWQFVGLMCLLLPAFIVAYAVAVAARRRSNQDALLWVLAIASEKQMPLGPGLQAVADQYPGVYRRQVLTVAHWLDLGRDLPEALDRVPGVLTRDARILIRIGASAGVMPQAIREAAGDRQLIPPGVNPLMARLGYLLGLLLSIQVVAGFVVYFIMPKMVAIFRDFGLSLPMVTVYFLALGNALLESYVLPILLVMEMAVLCGMALHLLGWLRLPSALLPSVFTRRHTVLILRSLAVVVESGQPLMAAIDALSRSYPDRSTRRRLARFRACVNHGGDSWACLWRQGLIRKTEAAVLQSAERTGNLPWALRELAETGQRRLVYRMQAWTQLLLPVAVVSIGALVGLFIVSYFLPMIQLIEGLAR